MDDVKYKDLTEDEWRFLIAWHNAPAEARWDALAMLINGRRPDGGEGTSTTGEGSTVVNIEDAKKPRA